MDKIQPLYKSNFEAFKTYVLSPSSDTVMIVKGLTPEDEVLASEIDLHILVNVFTDGLSKFNKCSKEVCLAALRRHIKRYMSTSNISTLSNSFRLTNTRLPLFKSDTKLFEKYTLRLISTPYNRGEGKIKGITLKDRRLRVSIFLQVLAQEIVKVSAQLTERNIEAVQKEFDQEVEEIRQAYNRLLSFGSNN